MAHAAPAAVTARRELAEIDLGRAPSRWSPSGRIGVEVEVDDLWTIGPAIADLELPCASLASVPRCRRAMPVELDAGGFVNCEV